MIVSTTDGSTITIQTKNTTETTILWSQTRLPEKGLRLKSVGALLCSEQSGGSNGTDQAAITIDHPGEFEFQEVFVVGDVCEIEKQPTGVIFAIDTEGMRILTIPKTITKALAQETYEKIGAVDVVLTSTNQESISIVSDIISQCEPRVVITTDDQNTASFTKKIGLQAERTTKLKLVKKDLPQEHTACFILTQD